MTRLYLIRHAAHVLQDAVSVGRTPGIALSDAGRQAAAELARNISDASLDAVLTSPRRRARETAQAIVRETSAPCEVVSDLDEVDAGEWTGMSIKALGSDPRWHVWNEQRDSARCPGGESMRDIAVRMERVLRQAVDRWPAGNIAIVTHAEPIRTVLLQCRGMSFDRFHEIDISPASVTMLTWRDGAFAESAHRRFAA